MIALATRAGDSPQASCALPPWFPLPAAIVYGTPCAIELATATSSAELAPPPRLMFATAGLRALRVTQSTPSMIPEIGPLPLQSNTRTGTRRTRFATP